MNLQEILIVNTTSLNIRESNQRINTVAQIHQAERTQCDVTGPSVTYAQNFRSAYPTSPRPLIDATDRRHIEALNEDKSHTTKETLDDIKRVHQKEKRKKEQTDIKLHQAGNFSQGPVSKEIICDYTLLNSFKVILEQ